MNIQRKEYNEQLKKLLYQTHEKPILLAVDDLNNLVFKYSLLVSIKINL